MNYIFQAKVLKTTSANNIYQYVNRTMTLIGSNKLWQKVSLTKRGVTNKFVISNTYFYKLFLGEYILRTN